VFNLELNFKLNIKVMMERVLIIGITGMDGSHAADYLLDLGYDVYGVIRRSSNFNTQRIEHIFDKLTLFYGDIRDMGNITNIISKVKPKYILNFAAMSHVKVSFELENDTFQTNTLGVLNVLQAVRALGLEKYTRVYNACTTEVYGNVTDGKVLLDERTEKLPVSPYGVSKLAAFHLSNMYRDAYGMFVVCSILGNHEGPRRGHTFVTQKIAKYVAEYSKGRKTIPLKLGNLDSTRDWGYAPDYIEGIWKMMTAEKPDNYVLATGETHSVREFVELAFREIGLEIEWRGVGLEEIGICKTTGETLVTVSDKYFRPIDIEHLIGDSSKAQKELGWYPKTGFNELVQIMVNYHLQRN